MDAGTNYQTNLITYLITRTLGFARDFLILPDRIHRWCVAAVICIITVLIACFITYAYAEKHQLVNSFFYGNLKFSFIDGGYPELFGYALELAASTLFATFAWVHNKKQWYSWSAILFVTFLDDAFKMHETIGHTFSVGLSLSPVVGDLIGFASTGLLSAVFWFAGLRFIQNRSDFSAYLVFTAYFALLMFFGVGIDALHGMIGKNMSQTVFTLFEDGGELVTTAIISLSSYGMWLRHKHTVSTTAMSIDSSALPKV